MEEDLTPLFPLNHLLYVYRRKGDKNINPETKTTDRRKYILTNPFHTYTYKFLKNIPGDVTCDNSVPTVRDL